MSHLRLPAVEMTLARTTYVGQILHSDLASSAVAWGFPNLEHKVFISFHIEIFIFKSTTPAGTNLFLVLQASESDESIMIDLKENILIQDSPNILACMNENPSSGVHVMFPDVPSTVDFETWMHASLLEVASEEDGLPFNRLVDLLTHPGGIEYDKEHNIFPALERLAEEMEETGLGAEAEEATD